MNLPRPAPSFLEDCDCLTPFGDAVATAAALVGGRRALQLSPVLGAAGGEQVPLALLGPMDETPTPRWLPPVRSVLSRLDRTGWGTPRRPVVVTSSNFGVGSLYAFTRDQDRAHLRHGPPFAAVELLRAELGWGPQVHVFSHACVTAHLGLAHAARLLEANLADRVLVLSFDLLSPFVAGGFHSLKILNGAFPAPFLDREFGAIGLGDGVAFAVLRREPAEFRLEAHALHNEMFHFTGNHPEGAGFAATALGLAPAVAGRRIWIKGHGTGTLDAGRLEARAWAAQFPGAPLVSWKGSLGHTLGSCGLVELAVTLAAWRAGRIPPTVGGGRPSFTAAVALEPFAADQYQAAILASNAFGGAHAAMLLSHG